MTKQIPQGYKQTKVGIIPEDWEVVRFGVIAKFFGGGTPSTQNLEFWKGDIPWISSSDLIEDNIRDINITRFITKEAVNNSATKIIPKNSILIVSRVGVGKIAINKHALCTSQDFQSAVLEDGNNYFFAYLLQLKTKKLIELNQGTSIKGLVKGDLSSLFMEKPPLKEQEKIAEILSTWDDAIVKQEQLIEQKQVFKKGIMQQIFSQKIRFKDDNGNDYPAWSNETLADVSDVRDGTHESPQYVEMGYPFITSKNLLENGNIDFINVNFISETDYNNFNKRSLVEISDILFGMIGTIGNPVIVKKTGFGIKNVALVKELQRLKNQYLIHYLRSYGAMKQFHQQNTGGTQKFIALGIIRQLTIKLPCIKEQNQIADLLTNIDDEITKQTEILEQLNLQKQSLMQKLLTGQVRVKI